MLDAWAIADTSGRLVGVEEGTLEQAVEAAQALAPGGVVHLDGMLDEYEQAAPLPVAANISKAARRARRLRRLRVFAQEAPIEERPELSFAALGLPELDLDEVLETSLKEAHEAVMPFMEEASNAWRDLDYTITNTLRGNFKMDKGDVRQTRATASGLSFAPHVLGFRGAGRAGEGETVCLRSTPECRASCLVYVGRNSTGRYYVDLKTMTTKAFLSEPVAFARILYAAVDWFSCGALARGLDPYVRLNVYSDVPWEIVFPELFDEFPDTWFYDYTKVPARHPPDNYDLSFSYSGRNQEETRYEVEVSNRRVVTVFLEKGRRRGKRLPDSWNGLPVIDGDKSDLRPLDPPNDEDPRPVCVGLRYKPLTGIYSRGKPIRNRDVFVVPCEIVDRDTVVVAEVPRHSFGLGVAAADEPLEGARSA